MNIEDFVSWVNAKPSYRHCEIKIENVVATDKVEVTIWVYDREVGASQYVKSVSEINLQAIKEKDDRAKFEKLKEKYG
jgi:hypothetical protein